MNSVRKTFAIGTAAGLLASGGLVLGLAGPAVATTSCAVGPEVIETQAHLTDAIAAAQSVSCPGSDTIDLDGNTIVLTASGQSTFYEITTPLIITNGTILVSGTGARLFSVATGAVLGISYATLGGGDAATSGGAIFVAAGATLAVDDSTLIDHHSGGSGGAIQNNGSTSVLRSAIVDSGANSGGAISSAGALTISNSTIAGNTSVDDGSAIQSAGTSAEITNSTIVENTGPNAVYVFSGTLELNNSIIGNNFGAPGCVKEAAVVVSFSAGTSNIIQGDGGCGVTNTNYLGIDPGITGAAGNPFHFRPLAGSPIIDAGDDASTGGAVLDQRGEPRILGTHVDLGSIERLPQTATVQFASAASAGLEGSGINPRYLLETSDGDPLLSSVQFSFQAAGGTATTADYSIIDFGVETVPVGTADGDTLPLTKLTIVNDDVLEPAETLQLVITGASGGSVGQLITTVHTIQNDDAAKLAATGLPTMPILGGAAALLVVGAAFAFGRRWVRS